MSTAAIESDLTAALKIETTVELVDHEGLGIIVSELNSVQQADFLTGLLEGFSRFEGPATRGLQLAFIADQFKDSPAVGRALADFLHDLEQHITLVVGS